MRIYKNKGKVKNSCSYCRQTGHNATKCDTAEYDWIMWSTGRVPLESPILQTNVGWWYKDNYTHWYRSAKRTAEKRAESEARKEAATKLPRRQTKCGFCGEENHTRRTCKTMKQVLADAHRANENWRRAFYQRMVREEGLSEGAAVKVDTARSGYWSRPKKPVYAMGLISKINWDDLSLFTSDYNISHDYRTDFLVEAIVNGENVALRFPAEFSTQHGEVCSKTKSWIYGHDYVSMVGRAERELSEEWASEGMKDEIKFLFKKRSYAKLVEEGIIGVIDTWKDVSC
jgi:hypothetical protein